MSTSAKTLIAAPVIYNELKDAEEKAIAVLGLLEDSLGGNISQKLSSWYMSRYSPPQNSPPQAWVNANSKLSIRGVLSTCSWVLFHPPALQRKYKASPSFVPKHYVRYALKSLDTPGCRRARRAAAWILWSTFCSSQYRRRITVL